MKASTMLTVPFVMALASASFTLAADAATPEESQIAELSFLQRIAALKQPGAVVLNPTQIFEQQSSASSSASGSASSGFASAVQSEDSEEAEADTTADDGKVGADEAAELVSKAWAEHATHTYDGTGTPGLIGRPTPTFVPPTQAPAKKMRRSMHKKKQGHGHGHAHHQAVEDLSKRNATVAADIPKEQVANNGTAATTSAEAGLPFAPAHTITFNLGTVPDTKSEEPAADPSAQPSVQPVEFDKRAGAAINAAARHRPKKIVSASGSAIPGQITGTPKAPAAQSAPAHVTSETTTKQTVAAAPATTPAAKPVAQAATTPAAAKNGRMNAEEAKAMASKLWAERATHTYNGVGTPGLLGRPTPTFVPHPPAFATPNVGSRMVKRLKEVLHVD